MDVALIFRLATNTVYHVLWEFIDAINKCDEVGPFFSPQTESACAAFAADFKVGDDGCAWCLTLKRCLILKRRLFVKGCW